LLTYSFAEKNDLKQLEDLWLASFNDKKEAVDFFLNSYNSYKALVCKDEERIVSALYLIPAKLDNKDVYYIYGASTDKNYRKRGIMGKLLSLSEKIAKENGIYAITLLPQTKNLVAFYEKYGYKEYFKCRTFSLPRKNDVSFIEADADINSIRNSFLPKCSLVWNDEHFEYIKDFYRFYNGGVIETKNSYAIISYCDKENCEITEVFSRQEDFDELFSAICSMFNSKNYIFSTSENLFLSLGETEYKGMIKFIDEGNDDKLVGGYLGAALE